MTETATELSELALGKILAVHLNYRSRAQQRGRTPDYPSYFLKPASSVAVGDAATGHTQLERPTGTELLAFEGEIALIIGKNARRVSPEQAWDHVQFITAANDFGLYDFRAADKGSNVRSKGGDGFTALGPKLLDARSLDPQNVQLRTYKNGELVQQDTSSGLLFPFDQLIADLSQLLTLQPGDVILTGTPAGSSVCEPGDLIEVEVSTPDASTGRLGTTITEGTQAFADYGAKPEVTAEQRADAWGNTEAAAASVASTTVAETAPAALSPETLEGFREVAVATLSAQLRQRGYNESMIDGVRPIVPGRRVAGVARTLRFIAQRPDLDEQRGKGFNPHKQIIDSLQPGQVLVMEARGVPETGTIGDILALRAQSAGAAGVITDGGIRDFAPIADLELPVFHRSTSPAVFGRRHIPWAIDEAITCGGAAVIPGDVLVGDDDGVVVIPAELAEEVLAAAKKQERQEEFITEHIAQGEALDGLYPMNEEWKARFQEWDEQ